MASEWVRQLSPNASEDLLLAARAHHVRRWEIPRSHYPEGRSGYLAWRDALHDHHATVVARVLGTVGYDDATTERVCTLVRKAAPAGDTEAQTLEDALCLAFLDTQLSGLAERLDEEKVLRVLRRTARKMSERAKGEISGLELTDSERRLVERALS